MKKLLALLFFFAVLGATPALAAPATLNPTADSYVYSTSPTSNYGSATILRSGFWVEFQQKFISLLKFDLSSIPDDAVITSAELKLYVSSGGSSGTMTAARNTEDWTESSVNWSTRPSTDDPRATALVSSGASYIPWDVTELVEDWFTGDHTNYGFSIVATAQETDFSADFFSREASGNHPELIVYYDRPLPTPTEPASGGPTSTPTPTPEFTPTPAAEVPTPTPTTSAGVSVGQGQQPAAVGTGTPTPETTPASAFGESGRRISTPSAARRPTVPGAPLLFISIVSGLLGVGVLGYILYEEIKKRRALKEDEGGEENTGREATPETTQDTPADD